MDYRFLWHLAFGLECSSQTCFCTSNGRFKLVDGLLFITQLAMGNRR